MATQSIFRDKRLDKEYDRLVVDFSSSGSSVINRACEEPSHKKAAYRFINNENVTVERIAQDIVNQCVNNVQSMAVTDVLIAQDTMETVRRMCLTVLKNQGNRYLNAPEPTKA